MKDYFRTHKHPRLGTRRSSASKEKQSRTRKELLESGKIKIWNIGKKCPRAREYLLKNPLSTRLEIRQKISKSLKEGYKSKKWIPHNLGKRLSIETRLRISQSRRGCSAPRTAFRKGSVPEWVLQKARKACGVRPNKPETLLMKIVEKNNLPFNYVGNGEVMIGGFNPDFLSKNPKHIIEVFGQYWHNIPKVKERDVKRFEAYARLGYKALVIWDYELSSPDQVIHKIKEFMDVG